ncbi:amiloride-sensitive sodium channel subunit alpha-like [Ptychodera flava]|uniref:amiloride-sensitive sodium channel subunit alpha-like n=1 Tax=Ptychodera flava TaxID=63121 RepID=UPI003969FD5D
MVDGQASYGVSYGIEVPLRREIGHQLGDLLISCQWNNFQCSPSNFTYLMNTFYGNCYTFNSATGSPALSTNFAGSTHGLTLELFVEQDEYLDSVTQSAGVRVTIHSQDETPFPEDNGFNIEPGKLTSVGITMGKTVRLPHPFTDCVSADTTEHEIAFKNSYSVEACMKSCLLTHIAEACNCTDGRYPKPDDYEDVGHCQYQNEEQRQCVSSADMLYEANRLACDCPPKCLTVSYAKETSSAVWPSSNSEDYVRGTLRSRSSKLRSLIEEQERTGQDLLEKNVLKLAVYFRDLTHQAISQSQLYTKMSLVSDIGGNLGLWIGLSVLTIMEFVELIFDMSAILGVLCSAKGKRTEMTGESERRVRQDGQFYKNPEQGVTYRNGDVYYTKGRNYDGDNERQYNGILSAHRDIYLPNGVI